MPKKTSTTAPENATASFATAFTELEELTRWFESGDIDLDTGIKKFERGLELAAICKTKLQDVEQKIKTLKVKFEDLNQE